MQVLADDFDVSLDRAGLLLTLLFLGSILASGAVAAWLHKYDPRMFAGFGLALVAAGTAGIGLASSWGWLLPAVAVAGIGGGLMDAGAHTIVARVSVDVPRGINRLNVCFAVGAIAGPLWSGSALAIDDGARDIVYLAIAALSAVVAVIMLTTRVEAGASHVHHHEPGEGPAPRMGRLAWMMGTVLFLYVGAEFGLGSWVASYAGDEFQTGTFAGGLITSGYWGSLMVGRLISGALFAHGIGASKVLLGSIVLGMVASAGIALANEVFVLAVVASFATGLAFGPIWPAAMAIAAEGRASSAPAAMVTVGNSGGFIFPWVQGRLLVSEGATTGIAMSAVLCAAMLAVAWRALRR